MTSVRELITFLKESSEQESNKSNEFTIVPNFDTIYQAASDISSVYRVETALPFALKDISTHIEFQIDELRRTSEDDRQIIECGRIISSTVGTISGKILCGTEYFFLGSNSYNLVCTRHF